MMENAGSEDQSILTAIDGRSLYQAVKFFLFQSAEIQNAIATANEVKPDFGSDFQATLGWFRNEWPLCVDAENVARKRTEAREESGMEYLSLKLNKGISPPMLPAEPDEVRFALERLFSRYNEFIGLLKTGALIAEGTASASAVRTQISSVFWESKDLRANLAENELGKGFGKDWSAEFKAIQIRLPALNTAALADNGGDASAGAVNKGGRIPIYPWIEAFECLAIELGEKGHPETGADLARMLGNALEVVGCTDLPGHDQIVDHLKRKHPRLWAHVLKRSGD